MVTLRQRCRWSSKVVPDKFNTTMKKVKVLIFLLNGLLIQTALYAQMNENKGSLSGFDLGLQLGGTGFVSFLIEKNFRFDPEGKVAAHLRTGMGFIFDPFGGGGAAGIPLGASVSYGGLYRFEVGTEMVYYFPSDLNTDGGYYPLFLGVRLQKRRLVARAYFIPILRWHSPEDGWGQNPWGGGSIAFVL